MLGGMHCIRLLPLIRPPALFYENYFSAVMSSVLCYRAKIDGLPRIIIPGALVAGARSSGTVR